MQQKITILNQHGDELLTFDRELAEAVNDVVTTADAEKAFADMKKAGYLSYTQNADGSNPEVIQRFDQIGAAEETVMSPGMQGG